MFSFDSPAASWGMLNAPHTGHASVTVTGLNFGLADYSSTSVLGQSSCYTASWTSSTSLECVSPAEMRFHEGQVREDYLLVTVAAFAGTRGELFSFDGPIASNVLVNAPHSGFSSVTVQGLKFGMADHTLTASISQAACLSSHWTTSTSVACFTAPYTGTLGNGEVTILGIVSTATNIFSYDAPDVTQIRISNAAHCGGVSVSVYGLMFGGVDYSNTASISLAACATSFWTTGTSVKCKMSGYKEYPGFGEYAT